MKAIQFTIIALVLGATSYASTFEIRAVLPEPAEDSESILWIRGGPQELVHLSKEVHLTEKHVAGASAKQTPEGLFYVDARLTDEGKDALATATREAKGGRLAILADGEILSVPTIRQEMTGGSFTIIGRFTSEEAANLATALNSAADRDGRTNRER